MPRCAPFLRTKWFTCRGLACVIALACGIGVVPAARADFLYANQTVTNGTGAPQTSMTIYLDGDQTSNITETVNPFGLTGTVSMNYDSLLNRTLVVFSGTTPVNPGETAHWGVGTSTSTLPFVVGHWDTSSDLFPIVSLSATSFGPVVSPIYYGLFYVELLLPGFGSLTQLWVEAPFGETGGKFTESNNTDTTPEDDPDPLGATVLSTIDSVVGGWYSYLPLDDLNEDYVPDPPTNPLFWVPAGAPSELQPGEMFMANINLPEPASLVAWSALFAMFVGTTLYRRRAAAGAIRRPSRNLDDVSFGHCDPSTPL